MNLGKKSFLGIVAIVICSTVSFSQGKISQQISATHFNFEPNKTSFSVNVKDVASFQDQYKDKIKIEYQHEGVKCFVINLTHREILNQLKADPNILFIDTHQAPKEEGEFDHVNSAFNRITKVRSLFPDVRGAAQRISIKEQSFDPANIDLINRSFTTSVTPTTISQHATTMATLMAGGGNSSYRTLGVAPRATFTSSDFTNLFPDNASVFTSNNISIQNHSYGVGIENYYGNEAQAYDTQVNNNPTLLHVFSVGNLGQSQPSSGLYQGLSFANITGNFKQAKNVLVVNAVDTTLTINTLNSRGPAFDGRLKPELTAFGQGGTSEASALVSGISALVQEKYSDLHGKAPDASLVKAILIASADDIGPAGIDFLYGYGNVNAHKAVSLVELSNYYETTLGNNDMASVPVNVPSAVAVLKIAVTWSDAPAVVNASSALVNDIDAWLEGGPQPILPWVLSSKPNVDSLMAPAKRKADHLNNVEYITLENPTAGLYQLKLKSNSLSTSDQKIAVAYWMEDQIKFAWDFPSQSDRAEGGKKTLLVWQAQKGQSGDLYLQINQGNWNILEAGINLDNYLYWKFPDTLATAKLKMVIGADEFVSDSFLISPLLHIQTAFNCTDSIGLTWNSLKGAGQYELYTMGQTYLQKIATTTDTLIVLNKSADQYFSIAPVMQTEVGLKSETINYTQQGAFCFLNFFSAIRFSADQIEIQLSISSWYNVDHITVYKTARGVKTPFVILTVDNYFSFEWLDRDLIAGLLTYQAEIVFKNGSTILSDAVDIPIEEKGKAILYPNPVSSSDSDLKIISQGGVKFRVLDIFGRIVFETALDLILSSIDVINLPSGLYLYQIVTDSEVTDTGRFVKL